MRLTRLNVSVHPRLKSVDLELSANQNILLGQNGTGKTTLLELVSSILTSDFSRYAHDALQLKYELAFEAVRLRVELSNKRAPHKRQRSVHAEPEPAPALGDVDVIEEYARTRFVSTLNVEVTHLESGLQLKAAYSPDGGQISVCPPEQKRRSHSSGSRLCPPVNPFEESPFLVPVLLELHSAMPDHEKQSQLLHCMRELLGATRSCYRFDEALGAFDLMVGHRRRRGASVVVRRRDGKRPGFVASGSYAMPEELIQAALNEAPKWVREKVVDSLPSFTLDSEALPFLEEACELMGFSGGLLEGQVVARERDDDDEHWRIHGLRFEFFEGGRAFTHEALSFGQKRILAFLYYVATNSHVVVADELVNGLHHHWIESALEHMGDRQAFLSSQNPLLLDHLEFESVEEVKRGFIICCKEGKPAQMAARNLTTQEASLFNRKLGAGVQQVSEILEDMGLW